MSQSGAGPVTNLKRYMLKKLHSNEGFQLTLNETDYSSEIEPFILEVLGLGAVNFQRDEVTISFNGSPDSKIETLKWVK